MSTPKELARELARQRKAHARFLKNLAPPLPDFRARMELKEFDWREETPEDRRDFGRILRGEGRWRSVRIPHFGPPLGRVFTYYRTAFTLTPEMMEKDAVFLCFGGVDYTAQVFVNGTLVGAHEGFFAPFELECTPHAHAGENVLVVKVGNDYVFMGSSDEPTQPGPLKLFQGDKLYAATGPGYDEPLHGWHHCPPGMGICQEVTVEARSSLFISDIFIRPLLAQERAEAWVEVTSLQRDPRGLCLDLSLFGANFSRTVFRGKRFTPSTLVVPGSGDVPGKETAAAAPLLAGPGANLFRVMLDIPSPRIWDTRTPWLYQVQVMLSDHEGTARDAAFRDFGMRSFIMDERSSPKGKLFLNGTEIRLRGANTMGFEQQDVMRGDFKQLADDILLAKICHMNYLRLTQRPVQPQVYEMCDRLGLMTQTDLPLFAVMRRTRFAEGVRQAGEMERLVRGHPCNVLVSFINEALPNAMNQPHRHLTRPELDDWVEAACRAVRLENPDRVIKPHDGDYDPPAIGLPDSHCYAGWYNGHGLGIGRMHRGWWQPVKPGWHYACGEFGSEGLDPVDLMKSRYPADWLPQTPAEESAWTPDRISGAQTGRFHFMWYDTPRTLDAWVKESRAHQAWVTRLMTEAFRRDARMNSFAIHLFNDAFPAGWMKAIMDANRGPKPAYFAYRDALSPVMVSLRTDRVSVRAGEEVRVEAWIANDLHEKPARCDIQWQAMMGRTCLAMGRGRASMPACSSECQGVIAFTAPEVSSRARMAIQAAVMDDTGRIMHDNEVLLDVFPRLREDSTAARRPALIVGGRDGRAASLARELGMACSFNRAAAPGDLILVDDLAAYSRHEQRILAAVRAGGLAVFIEIPNGSHRICGSDVLVRATGMGEFFFASRATGHPLVKDFQPRDFFFWLDPKEDCVMPLLSATLDAPGWETVLSTGHVSWSGASVPAQACAEKRLGKGSLRICQVKLAGRLLNPPAELFARRLVTLE